MQIVISLVLLSFLILIHELGHFGAAKLFKVKVKEFSVFMGPKIFSFKSKKTEYSIRAVPIGGYVVMEGETEDSDDKDALLNKPKWQQALIMFSGAFMNLLFGLLAFFILINIAGYTTTDLADTQSSVPDINIYIQDETQKYDLESPAKLAGLQDGDKILEFNGKKITYPIDVIIFAIEAKDKDIPIKYERNGVVSTTILKPVIIPETTLYKMGVFFRSSDTTFFDSEIDEVSPDSPAQKAGILQSDRIISIDETLINEREDIVISLLKSNGESVLVKLLREGKEIDVSLVPEKVVQEKYFYNGLYFRDGNGSVLDKGKASINYFASIIKSVYFSIKWLIKGKISFGDAMGPVGIITTLGNVVASKDSILNIVKQLLSLMGLISINLGFINLLPFPALDGSKLVILGVEAISRKKIPIEKQAMISFIGFALLIIMLIAITSVDIMRLFRK